MGQRISYQRLRAPDGSGESLQVPPLSTTAETWNHSVLTDDSAGIELNGVALSARQQEARRQLRQLAFEYTRQYLDVVGSHSPSQPVAQPDSPIIMSGHQPLLFHPGVWFKNFALSALSHSVGALAVNLVVDNDISGAAAIRCPRKNSGTASIGLVPIDDPHHAIPHEARPVVNQARFESFGATAVAAMNNCYQDWSAAAQPALVEKLWPEVIAAQSALGKNASLGAVLAAGRHRLEARLGLRTLEIPVSLLAKTQAFAQFAADIIIQQETFNTSYNTRLAEYRKVHKIRSMAHPVPSLERDGQWLEAPFWIWSQQQPTRRRLFVKARGRSVELTDRNGWQRQTDTKQLTQTLFDSNQTDIAIRPRALTTTMFCRLMLCDRFLHGIGGAKYDQLTDLIASDMFGVPLPPFSTLTASVHLPLNQPLVTRADQSTIAHQIRERHFHPETFVDRTSATAATIAQKQAAIADDSLSRRERHEQIARANEQLRPFLAGEVKQLQQQLAELPDQIRSSQIANSREYSFCLFPDSLTEELRQMASTGQANPD